MALAGDLAYEAMMQANHQLNRARARLGMGYWSLSAFAKDRVKRAVNIVSRFEESVARECRRRGLDGVICGHIHHAEIREMDGIRYMNCGDWVESCTALAEDFNGEIHLIRWVELDHLNRHPTVTELPLASGA